MGKYLLRSLAIAACLVASTVWAQVPASRRIAVLVAEGFNADEFWRPYYVLKGAGCQLVIVSPEKGVVKAGSKDRSLDIAVDIPLSAFRAEEYDAFFIPGGHSPAHLLPLPEVAPLVRQFAGTGKPVAAICHGPMLLAQAGLLKGRYSAYLFSAEAEVPELFRQGELGAYLDWPVVQSHNLIMSRYPEDAEAFARVLLARLGLWEVVYPKSPQALEQLWVVRGPSSGRAGYALHRGSAKVYYSAINHVKSAAEVRTEDRAARVVYFLPEGGSPQAWADSIRQFRQRVTAPTCFIAEKRDSPLDLGEGLVAEPLSALESFVFRSAHQQRLAASLSAHPLAQRAQPGSPTLALVLDSGYSAEELIRVQSYARAAGCGIRLLGWERYPGQKILSREGLSLYPDFPTRTQPAADSLFWQCHLALYLGSSQGLGEWLAQSKNRGPVAVLAGRAVAAWPSDKSESRWKVTAPEQMRWSLPSHLSFVDSAYRRDKNLLSLRSWEYLGPAVARYTWAAPQGAPSLPLFRLWIGQPGDSAAQGALTLPIPASRAGKQAPGLRFRVEQLGLYFRQPSDTVVVQVEYRNGKQISRATPILCVRRAQEVWKDNHHLNDAPDTVLYQLGPAPQGKQFPRVSWQFWDHDTLLAGRKARVRSHRLSSSHELTSVRLLGVYPESRQIVISPRYRGLGQMEQVLDARHTGFSTADIWPAPWGKPRLTSADPNSFEAQLSSANLFTLARGGGIPWWDCRVVGQTLHISWHPQVGDYRAHLSAAPGQGSLQIYEEEYFPETPSHRTNTWSYATLQAPDLDQPHRYRTLWRALDEAMRASMAQQLGIVQPKVKPAVGFNWDFFKPGQSYARAAENLAFFAPELARSGVRMVLNHNAGWLNGQGARLGLDGQNKSPYLGSGTCNVYDYRPLPAMTSAWKQLYDSLHKHRMDYLIWVTGMVKKQGTFALEARLGENDWAQFSPKVLNNVYGTDMGKFNIWSSAFGAQWQKRLDSVEAHQGFDGFWLDSWHNLWQSSFDVSLGKPRAMNTAWMRYFAPYTRRGKTLIAEGYMEPGLSCTIEVPGWQSQPWYMGHTIRWLRNGEHESYSADSLNRLGFKLLACGGWLAFDILAYNAEGPYVRPETIMPRFADLARLWEQVQGHTHTLEFLPQEAGVLWKDAKGRETVLFTFREGSGRGKLLYQDGSLRAYGLGPLSK